VVNFNGGQLVHRCIELLLATDYPCGDLEVVVVDNASMDGSGDALADKFPGVRVERSPVNLGFAGGCNLGMRDLRGVDHVALVNSDALVTPGWLTPLVEALDADAQVGAVCPKILFASRFVELDLSAEAESAGGGDTRALGVRLSGVRCEGEDGWRRAGFPRGFYWPETDRSVASEPQFRWSEPEATLWAPVPRDLDRVERLELRMAAVGEKTVGVRCGSKTTRPELGRDPRWVEVDADAVPFDVVNNAGSLLVNGGYGADRGFRQRDDGTFDRPAEVFAWCGAAVVLSGRYLADVGTFCGRYFLYYEDFDLSWRGRSRGWRYLFVPSSVVHHVHAASTVEGSALFDHYVHRNRLLTLVKNAPAGFVARQLWAYAGELRELATQEVVLPAMRRQRPHPDRSSRQLRAAVGFAKNLPHALRARRQLGARHTVDRDELLSWMERADA
jgi:GT2 family glycosyltransferase